MIKTAGLITALCLATSFAKELNFFLKKQRNATNYPPYDNKCSLTVPDPDTLLEAMKIANDTKCNWKYAMSSLFLGQWQLPQRRHSTD